MELYEILVLIFAVIICSLIIVKIILDKKKGKNSCGCDCAHCKMNCHANVNNQPLEDDQEETTN